MKYFVLLAFIPSLITADNLCPNSKTTCPIDKKCCEVDGEYSCCDLDDNQDLPDTKLKVHAGVEMKSSAPMAATSLSANETMLYYGGCDFSNCPGKCCTNSWDGCCPHSIATCCGNNKCCPGFGDCCRDGCCSSLQKCCGNGCCSTLEKCCSGGCCKFGYNCCDGWCCKEGYRCGKAFRTCYSKGAIISPEFVALFLTAVSIFISHRF